MNWRLALNGALVIVSLSASTSVAAMPTEPTAKVRNGGVVLMTYNDCNFAHGVALAEELLGDGTADAGRAPGDEDGVVVVLGHGASVLPQTIPVRAATSRSTSSAEV